MAVELLLERDDDALEGGLCLLPDEVGHFADVGVVQGCVNLVQHKEGRRLEAAGRWARPSGTELAGAHIDLSIPLLLHHNLLVH